MITIFVALSVVHEVAEVVIKLQRSITSVVRLSYVTLTFRYLNICLVAQRSKSYQ
jgi:hypothetical protein